MSAVIDLKEIEKRANYAAYQDGLMEIFMGLFLFLYGGALATSSPPLGFVFIVLTVIFGKKSIERLKQRFIYPRIGYVKLPTDPNTTGRGIVISAILMVVALLGAMGISMAVIGREAGMDFFLTMIVPPASGFMLGIGPFWLGQTYGLFRGYLWAVLFVLGGIAFPVFSITSGYEAVGLLCTVMGLLILATGIFMFVRFIRRYAPESGEIEEMANAS
jgi:hypothetical protein